VRCPFCSSLETKVIDSRINQQGDITRRRRSCFECGGRFTTYERVEAVMPAILKKDGRRESYQRSKLVEGIEKACQKRNINTLTLEELVNRIERRVQSYGLKELPSHALGQMVMSELHQLDKVAYIRFASVYREFKDVEEFMTELKEPEWVPSDQNSMTFPFLSPEQS